MIGGLHEPCIMDEYHTEDCGRCPRRNFFLDRYGTASSLRGTELAERHLGRKYYGKDEGNGEDKKKIDGDARLKAVLRNVFASRNINFFDGDNREGWPEFNSDNDEDDVVSEHDDEDDTRQSGHHRIRRTVDEELQVEIPIRTMFSRPNLWTSQAH
jgi:hypothetical protein